MKRGFTLLELLIVIGILAILAGAMVPLFSYSRQSAAIIRAQRDEDIIVKAAMMYQYDTEQWPPVNSKISSDSDESCLITNNAEWGCPTNEEGWNGPYLAEGSNDPWGNPYRIIDANNYCPPGFMCAAIVKSKRLVVQSFGPDETDAGCKLGDDLCTPFFVEGGGGGGGGGGFIK